MSTAEYDVVVLGTGGAGCAATLEAVKFAPRVLAVSKSRLDDSKTANAQGGLQAATGPGDSPEKHFADTVRAGSGKCDERLVKILTEGAPDTVKWLEAHGVAFDREDGDYKRKSAAGVSVPRVLSCGDSTGNRVIAPLLKAFRTCGAEVRDNTGALSIAREGDSFTLELREADSGKTEKVRARAVVLATGGALPPEKKAGLALEGVAEAPDGLQLAQQIGAEVFEPDLMQYHPTGIVEPKALRRERLPETMRAAGAVLLNKDRVEFTDALMTRNALTQAIVTECRAGRGVETEDGRVGVWLDTTRIEPKMGAGYIAVNYPKFDRMFKDIGHDLTKHPVLVYPIVHYTLGGVVIDPNAQSTVPGVFAAGETAYGVHGTERLMGNSLLDIFVFGRIAGKNAARFATGQPLPTHA